MTTLQLKELLRQQRELCAKAYMLTMPYDENDCYKAVVSEHGAIVNAPEPEPPVVEPNSVEGLIQKWQEEEASLWGNPFTDNRGAIAMKQKDIADLKQLLADLKALAVQPTDEQIEQEALKYVEKHDTLVKWAAKYGFRDGAKWMQGYKAKPVEAVEPKVSAEQFLRDDCKATALGMDDDFDTATHFSKRYTIRMMEEYAKYAALPKGEQP